MTKFWGLVMIAVTLALVVIAVTLFIGRAIDQNIVRSNLRTQRKEAVAVVGRQRAACLRASQRSVLIANFFRADEVGNLAVANDPRQPSSTRKVRGHEARLERQSLLVLAHLIDPSTTAGMNAAGRQLIRSFGNAAFNCNNAFPYP